MLTGYKINGDEIEVDNFLKHYSDQFSNLFTSTGYKVDGSPLRANKYVAGTNQVPCLGDANYFKDSTSNEGSVCYVGTSTLGGTTPNYIVSSTGTSWITLTKGADNAYQLRLNDNTVIRQFSSDVKNLKYGAKIWLWAVGGGGGGGVGGYHGVPGGGAGGGSVLFPIRITLDNPVWFTVGAGGVGGTIDDGSSDSLRYCGKPGKPTVIGYGTIGGTDLIAECGGGEGGSGGTDETPVKKSRGGGVTLYENPYIATFSMYRWEGGYGGKGGYVLGGVSDADVTGTDVEVTGSIYGDYKNISTGRKRGGSGTGYSAGGGASALANGANGVAADKYIVGNNGSYGSGASGGSSRTFPGSRPPGGRGGDGAVFLWYRPD